MPGPDGVPVIDARLARRVEEADTAYVAARVEAMAALPGNPLRALTRRVGPAVVLRAPGSRSSMFNRILLADDSLLPHLDEALAAAGGPLAPARVDVVPPLPSDRLMRALSRRGFACAAHYSALYGLPRTLERPRAFAGRVRPLQPGEVDTWVDVYLRGFGFPSERDSAMAVSLRGLAGHPRATLLLAELEGRPAGMAVLWVEGTTGYLAVATTLPEARGRGCQSALIDARIALAAERGCDLVAGHAAVGSASQRNMETAGLRLAFHKGIWTRPPA